MHLNPATHRNPLLFEINTHVWIKKFGEKTTLDKVPMDFFNELHARGFEYVWLMGVWQRSQSAIEKYCFEEGLEKEYSAALPDWQKEDVIGSPYSIEDYVLSPELGTEQELISFKEKLNEQGIKLILDFIPNHFSAESSLIKSNPEVFLMGTEEELQNDPKTFFKKGDKIFAHGKDPFFDAWQDTIQVNYFDTHAREFMMQRLEQVSNLCDGIRCDMAMLADNFVFSKTWGNLIEKYNFEKPHSEFWRDAILKIKYNREDFAFIAEVYWDKEWQLQQLGFDFTYDKKLLERLQGDDINEIKAHLWASDDFQKKCVRFLENHDEQRSIKVFGQQKIKAALVALLTLQGMKIVNDGQCDGKQIKLPVQLGREPKEGSNREIRFFYDKLYQITKNEIFHSGSWEPIEPDPAWEGSNDYQNFLSWLWSKNDERILVVINYSDRQAQCSIKFDTKEYENEFPLKDLLNDVEYVRSAKEISNIGLYVDLGPYKSHIFYF